MTTNCSKEVEERPTRVVETGVCPSCGHEILPSIIIQDAREKEEEEEKVLALHDLPGLPAGVKFDPTDHELLEYLDGKVKGDVAKLHPLLHEFIPLIQGKEGICYTHPEKLPGVSMGGHARHFFHYPSKAYTTGTRKRKMVQTDEHGSETRWHKTGKTRPIFVGGETKGHKKILVLYTATKHGMGDASIPSGLSRRRERTGVGGLQSVLSNAAETVCLEQVDHRLTHVEG